ncbi:aminoglycoside phosphotransferase family protein [Actinoplanes philippinensis]|uniref:aminoglycoside phosphotransferase family protein n=1 Tax=Actinoplanes philippinensis TaxID=35752 RepID=UPI0033E39508
MDEVFDGGNMGGAVRVGGTVRRTAGPWSPTIQRLLHHVRDRGINGIPEPLGADEHGRDNVSYLAGVVPRYPLPDWVWSDAVLVDTARFLAAFHEASADFDVAGATWQVPVHHPVEVICHNDFAPYNMVFNEQRLTAVIDWDTASPGPRVWDLAYLAYRIVPLTDPANSDGLGNSVIERARRLRLLCDTYGHRLDPSVVLPVVVQRLHDLAAFTEARATAGREHLSDHAALYRRDAVWIDANTGDLR